MFYKNTSNHYSIHRQLHTKEWKESNKMLNEYYNIKHLHLNESRGIFRKEDNKFREFGASLLGLPHDYSSGNGEFVQIYKDFPELIYLHKTYYNVIPEIENLHIYYMHSFNCDTECISVNDEVSKYGFVENSVANYIVSRNRDKIISVSIIMIVNPGQNKLQDFLQTTFYHELNHIIYRFKSNISIEDLNGDSKYALEGLAKIAAISQKQNIVKNSYLEFEQNFFDIMYYCNRSELCAYLENVYNYLKIYKRTLSKEGLYKTYDDKIDFLASINDTMNVYYILSNQLNNNYFDIDKNKNAKIFWKTHSNNLGKIYSPTGKAKYKTLISLYKSRIKTFMHKAIKIYDDILETL